MTPADLQFVRTFFLTGGNALQAFRAAFDPDEGLSEPEVIAQVAALFGREDIQQEMRSTNRNAILRELEAARQKALSEPGGAHAAVAASAVKAHLLGVLPGAPHPALVYSPAPSAPPAAHGSSATNGSAAGAGRRWS